MKIRPVPAHRLITGSGLRLPAFYLPPFTSNRRAPGHQSLLIMLCCAIMIAFLTPAAGAAESGYFEPDREFYPYYPSLVKWNKSSAPFTEPEVCAGCHPRQYEEWTGSVHSLAFQDPLYQGELNRAYKAAGHEVTRWCEGCHSPVGMVTGEIKAPGLAGLGRMALAGVSCDVCHSVSGVTHWDTPSREPGNGSLILSPGIDTRDGMKLVKYGPDKPGPGCGGGFHDCVQVPLLVRADLCASCHQVSHYENFFPIESTYYEWVHSPYGQAGVLCQDCHMVDIETFIRTADTIRRPERAQYRHYFGGANYLLFSLEETAARNRGDASRAENLKKKYDMAVARLKAAADLEILPQYKYGILSEIIVRVKNVRAGHNLPTSLTNIRQMWLEVTARDIAGNIILKSGGMDSAGALTWDTRIFNSEGMGKDFHFASDAWDLVGYSRNVTIPPRGHWDVNFSTTGVKKHGIATVVAKLRYRQADQRVANKLMRSLPPDMSLEKTYGIKSLPSMPVVDMVVKKEHIRSKE
jgi:cytochrome c553